MSKDAEISAILKKYFAVEDAKILQVINDINRTTPTAQIEAAKNRILKKLEVHNQAEDLIEAEVSRYREDLYVFAKRMANNEMEKDIITKAHVIKAKQVLWRRRSKYSFADGFLALGGLFLGIAVPHIISLVQHTAEPSMVLIVSGIIGGFLLGMGIIGKATQT